MDKKIINNILNSKVLKELQSVATTLYIFGVGIGMLFNYYKYKAIPSSSSMKELVYPITTTN